MNPFLPTNQSTKTTPKTTSPTLIVIPKNQPAVVKHIPIAFGQSVITSKNIPVSIFLTGEDTNPNVNLTASIVTAPSHGTLGTINQDTGNVIYRPNLDFVGLDSFAFIVSDEVANSNATIFSIRVK